MWSSNFESPIPLSFSKIRGFIHTKPHPPQVEPPATAVAHTGQLSGRYRHQGDGCREEMRAELIGVVVMVEARVRMAGAMVERWWQLGLGDGYEGFLCAKTITMV
ncbi:hypothetical protein V6N12_065954 [Hibiscus sabdariffa]|uniref:Uncharacterized protein n=1 Tax=Hibiscus sabdariffa TaxID=183260 RepID=A0ABR2AII1_9ROSI